MQFQIALNDERRLAALDAYDILDTPREEAFDRITRLIKRVFNVEFSTVTFLDGHRQWFKSYDGFTIKETARSLAFCKIPVVLGEPLVVPDTLADPRFADNLLVTGDPHLRFYAGVPVKDRNGLTLGTVCAMDRAPRAFPAEQVSLLTDFARIVENELELRLLASVDGLTGALTRRTFRQEVDRIIALAIRHEEELSCVSFDLDHFKQINDRYGHAAGDAVLKRTIEVCARLLRKSDFVARLGGEEFAVILPHTGLPAALHVAERIRLAVQRMKIEVEGEIISVTASFGVTDLDRKSPDLDALLAVADKALYLAKAKGRNCACVMQALSSERAAPPRALKGGLIVFDSGRCVIECTVRRLSDMGAELCVSAPAEVPRQFKLEIDASDLSRACEVVAKGEHSVNVVFS